MASGALKMTWEDIHVLDRVGSSYKEIPREISAGKRKKAPHPLLLVDRQFNRVHHATLIHQGDKTYFQGQCPELGLEVPYGQTTKRECKELRGKRVVQAVLGYPMVAYVLTDGGVLLSCGDQFNGRLGRRTNRVPMKKFGLVAIDDPVLAVTVGWKHVLAMTSIKVFAFGKNNADQAGVPGIEEVPEPREIYSGKGPQAPKQVACGELHSVILTVGGQVLTCGYGERTGHGHTDNVPQMTAVPRLRCVAVQQIGCTAGETYALSNDGLLYGFGCNGGTWLCVDPEDGIILEPTVVDCGGHRISSFRCSWYTVLALTDKGEALHWGHNKEGVVIPTPEPVEGCSYPREVFARGYLPDSGGTVYMEPPENEKPESAAATCPHKCMAADLQEARRKIAELQNALEAGNRREAAAQEACYQVQTKLLEAEARISSLETVAEDAKRRETEVRNSADSSKRLLEQQICDLEARITRQQVELDSLKEGAMQRESVVLPQQEETKTK